jgi:DnaK suppressor protein
MLAYENKCKHGAAMTPEQFCHFKQCLAALRSELLDTGEKARESTKPVQLDQASIGRVSRVDALQVQAMALETQRRRQVQLQLVERALKRIESGDYGICSACDDDIAVRRLEFDPTATLCIACASARER